MFSVGFSELLVIFLIAFVVVGPEDLPKVARWIARTIKNLRGIMKTIKEESGINEIEREIKDTGNFGRAALDIDDASKEIRKELRDMEGEL